MGLLVVPGPDPEPWPSLGREVCEFIEDRGIYGPGSLQGEPYVIDPEFRAFIYRASEVYPATVRRPLAGGKDHAIDPHPWAGRRRFKRVGLSVRKGLAKTEKQALFAFVELHPEGPSRCDGFDASGNPVGRPVRAPYIPMLAVTVEQVEELAYGALKYIVENGPDADLFDSGLDRILRIDENGHEDGKAVALANSPGARDGARTTLNCFDEPHRLYLPRQKQAHATMAANLPKRPLDDPWSLYVGTAGELGQESVAEELHLEAEMIRDGIIKRADLFYLYRTDDKPTRDLSDKAERIQAIREATGPAGEWGPGQFDDIASQWDRPKADPAFLERVWLNRWVKSGQQAFDLAKWKTNVGDLIPDGAMVSIGFDGAVFRDSTGIVVTDVETGVQRCMAYWERPPDYEVSDEDGWEVPVHEVEAVMTDIHTRYQVVRAYGDPPYWIDSLAKWCGRWPKIWHEWWTNSPRPMSYAVRSYVEAIRSGTVRHEVGRPYAAPRESALERHVGNAGRKDINLFDDEGQRLFILQKIHPDRKFDIGMAAVLSWQARTDAVAKGAKRTHKKTATAIRAR